MENLSSQVNPLLAQILTSIYMNISTFVQGL